MFKSIHPGNWKNNNLKKQKNKEKDLWIQLKRPTW
jgi:hypothetical protein